MISVTIFKDRNMIYKGLECTGHAGYDDHGKDIVCSAASMLVINTVNSIEQIAGCKISVKENAKKGYVNMTIDEASSKESLEKASLFMESLILGIKAIRSSYGKKYVTLDFKEV